MCLNIVLRWCCNEPIYRLRHLKFFYLVLISWTVTLSSSPIWQIISFILPPNEYLCTRLNNAGKYCDITLKNFTKIAYGFWKNCYLVKKVKATGILIDKPKPEKPRTVLTPENIAAVAESVCEAPSTSNHSETSLRRILHKDLGMMPYNVQWVQWPIGHPMRFRFAYKRCRFWQNKIILSDEAHIDLGGYVNKQNCRIWDTENPHAYIEKPTHPKRVTVWWEFWSKCIIGHKWARRGRYS